MENKHAVIPKILSLFRGLYASKTKGRPLFVSHLVTTRCHCRCPMCLWRDQERDQEMSAAEIGRFYRDLRRNGFVQVGIWGGEPLLRDDLDEILYHANQAGLLTVLVTNGFYLEERLKELSPYLDAVILSLDYAGEEQDQMRGCPGLYERVISAMRALRCKYPGIKVFFNMLLHRGNEDQVYPLARLAWQMGITFYVCPVKDESFRGSGKNAEEWKPEMEKESFIAAQLVDLKSKGYPLNNSYTYLKEFLRDKRPYVCHLPKVSVMVYPDGEVINCMNSDQPLGYVREESMEDILKKPEYNRLKSIALNCNHCNNPNVVDTSFIWGLRREPLFNAVKVLLKS